MGFVCDLVIPTTTNPKTTCKICGEKLPDLPSLYLHISQQHDNYLRDLVDHKYGIYHRPIC